MISPDIKIRLAQHRKKTIAWARGGLVLWKDDKDYKAPKNLEALNECIALIHQVLKENWIKRYPYA